MIFPQRDRRSRVYYVCSTAEADRQQRANQPATLIGRLAELLPAGAMKNVVSEGPVGFFPNSERLATVKHGPNTVLIGEIGRASCRERASYSGVGWRRKKTTRE